MDTQVYALMPPMSEMIVVRAVLTVEPLSADRPTAAIIAA